VDLNKRNKKLKTITINEIEKQSMKKMKD